MAVLDDLSGFEFEDVMEDVFRNLGYENVRQSARTADEGRDILMDEVVDGERRAVVVECKHQPSIGRPVVQKLHSAIATFDHSGPKRGIVVTTGTFTKPAKEYAARLKDADDPYPIELIDGRDLREIADDIGLDLYNGRIEILCDETLRPHDPTTALDTPVCETARDIKNFDPDTIPEPHSNATFRPVVIVTARTNAIFETTVGVIHRVNEQRQFAIHADRGSPLTTDDAVTKLVTENRTRSIPLEPNSFEEQFDAVDIRRFGQTETEYKDWAVDRLRSHYTTTVTYTGDNNVTYTKTCEPNRSDISIQSIDAIYLPEIRQTVDLLDYAYAYEYYAAGPSRVTLTDDFHDCVHCDRSGESRTYTYCANCGSINCTKHTKTERLEGTPICTGCAITERFALRKKYFYNEANLEAFRDEYADMALHERALENKPLIAASITATLIISYFFLGFTGLI